MKTPEEIAGNIFCSTKDFDCGGYCCQHIDAQVIAAIQAERDKVQKLLEVQKCGHIAAAIYDPEPSMPDVKERCELCELAELLGLEQDKRTLAESQVQAAREEGRRQGLEEAAKLAYAMYVQQKCGASDPEDEKFDDGYIKAGKDIAEAIRALASAPKMTEEKKKNRGCVCQMCEMKKTDEGRG